MTLLITSLVDSVYADGHAGMLFGGLCTARFDAAV